MAGDTLHAGHKKQHGWCCDAVKAGVISPEVAKIEAFGLSLQQIQVANLQVGETYLVQGTQWTDQDAVDLGITDVDRWVEIQRIDQAMIGGSIGQISWTDHYTYVRIVHDSGPQGAHIKYVALQ